MDKKIHCKIKKLIIIKRKIFVKKLHVNKNCKANNKPKRLSGCETERESAVWLGRSFPASPTTRNLSRDAFVVFSPSSPCRWS